MTGVRSAQCWGCKPMRHELTTTPAPLAGIEAGLTYSMQNHSLHVVHFRVASAVPTDLDDASKLPPDLRAVGRFSVEDGENCYVWINHGILSGTVTYFETP